MRWGICGGMWDVGRDRDFGVRYVSFKLFLRFLSGVDRKIFNYLNLSLRRISE